MIVLHKKNGATNSFLENSLVEAFKEKAAFIIKDNRFDDFYIWNVSACNFH